MFSGQVLFLFSPKAWTKSSAHAVFIFQLQDIQKRYIPMMHQCILNCALKFFLGLKDNSLENISSKSICEWLPLNYGFSYKLVYEKTTFFLMQKLNYKCAYQMRDLLLSTMKLVLT